MPDTERLSRIVKGESPANTKVLARVEDNLGLHLRVAARFADTSRRFAAEVRVRLNGLEADGKSVLDLVCLGAECGALLELEARGEDAGEAIAALSALLMTSPVEIDGGRPHGQ